MKIHWKYHKINAIMFISPKNMMQNSLGVDFYGFIRFLRVLKTALKILPIVHT